MIRKSLFFVVFVLAVASVQALHAQEDGAAVRSQDGGREAVGPAVGHAVERSAPAPSPAPAGRFVSRGQSRPADPAPPAATPQAAPRGDTRAVSTPGPMTPVAADDQRRRDGGRDRGDNPVVGRAVPREARSAPAPAPPIRDGRVEPRFRSSGVYVAPRVYNNNYYYYPRRYYPYGYGAFGLGYFYYDPYTWYPPSYSAGYYGGYSGGYSGGYFDEGELRIDVSPSSADVYVDGYFAGRVDDYDGVFQSLKLASGAHHIQIVAPGFAPLDFDVRIEPGRKITYRGTLQTYRP